MLDDLHIPRELGMLGGFLLCLVGLSSFFNMKSWVEQPMNDALATQMEKKIDWSILSPEQTKQYQTEIRQTRQESQLYIKIDIPGTILWSIGFMLIFFKSLWGVRSIIAGVPFKIWANLYDGIAIHSKSHGISVGIIVFLLFDIGVLLMTLGLGLKWKKETTL